MGGYAGSQAKKNTAGAVFFPIPEESIRSR